MDCREVERFADLSLDGEIGPSEQAELEGHLGRCAGCRQSLHAHHWLSASIRAKLRDPDTDTPAPGELRARIGQRIRTADERGFPWSRALPATVALGVFVTAAWVTTHRSTLDPEEPVLRHSRNLPPDVRARRGEAEVIEFLRRHQVPDNVPRFGVTNPNVRLVGARVSSLSNQDSTYLMYDHRGARISLFAAPRPRSFVKPAGFTERVSHGQPLLVGSHRGYNVVAWRSGGTLYTLVSEVDQEELVKLAASPDR